MSSPGGGTARCAVAEASRPNGAVSSPRGSAADPEEQDTAFGRQLPTGVGLFTSQSVGFERSRLTAQAIESQLYDSKRQLFGICQWWTCHRWEALWPVAGAWSAAVSLAAVSPAAPLARRLEHFVGGLAQYHPHGVAAIEGEGPVGFRARVVGPLPRRAEVFFDDNAWVALALLGLYDLTGDGRCLDLASRVTEFVLNGWSTDRSWAHPGGIPWRQAPPSTTRNTCANAPAAEAAVALYLRTRDPRWLDAGRRVYEWVRTALGDRLHLYADHLDPDGRVTTTLWSYLQGSMIGAGVLLARATGEEHYLDEATSTARAAIDRFGTEALLAQPAAFNAVYFRNLSLLHRVRAVPALHAVMADYGDRAWDLHRDASSGLFAERGMSPLNATAAMVEIYALLAGAEPHP